MPLQIAFRPTLSYPLFTANVDSISRSFPFKNLWRQSWRELSQVNSSRTMRSLSKPDVKFVFRVGESGEHRHRVCRFKMNNEKIPHRSGLNKPTFPRDGLFRSDILSILRS